MYQQKKPHDCLLWFSRVPKSRGGVGVHRDACACSGDPPVYNEQCVRLSVLGGATASSARAAGCEHSPEAVLGTSGQTLCLLWPEETLRFRPPASPNHEHVGPAELKSSQEGPPRPCARIVRRAAISWQLLLSQRQRHSPRRNRHSGPRHMASAAALKREL